LYWDDVLNEQYDLPSEQIVVYRSKGHVTLRGILPATVVAGYQKIISDVVKRRVERGANWHETDERGKKESLTVMDIRRINDEIYRFVTAPRFAQIAADLMGVSRVRVLGDFAVFKEPNDKHTRWHQDNNHIVIDTDNTITMWMPLIDVNESMGTMTFISGSHYLADRINGDAANLLTATRKELPMCSSGDMRMGDVTFHSGTTIHMAGENKSDVTREVLTIMYFEDGARFMDPERMPGFEKSKHRAYAMEGYQKGELAGGADFPLVHGASTYFSREGTS